MWSDFLCAIVIYVLTLLQNCICETQNATNGCDQNPTCLKCGSSGCIKCPNLIVFPSRSCVDSCPFGYKVKWSKEVDFMGQICVKNTAFVGLTADAASVLTGVICGLLLCVAIIVGGVLYLRTKRRVLLQSSETNSDTDDTPEKRDFLKQVEILRPNAQTFLEMLNDTRRQMRELHQEGNNTAVSVYKPVVRDLAKVLILLNRPVEVLTPPEDWEHLYNWAEQVVRRYKRMSEGSQTQVGQLIKFLQSPIDINTSEDCSRSSTIMSTFKPDQPLGSSLSLQENRVKNESNFNSPLNPQWQFNYPLIAPNQLSSSEFTPSQWKQSKEYLGNLYFLEDDFTQLGFRPQDEITTEL